MNQARNAQSAFGTYQDLISAGGNAPPGKQANAEQWNGSSWAEQNNLNTARATAAASASTTAGLYFGGSVPGSPERSAATEEWTSPSNTVKTLTD